MDPLKICENYLTFRAIIRGSTLSPGFFRRWCFPALADVVGNIVVQEEGRFWQILPENHAFWGLLRRGFTVASFTEIITAAQLENRGRQLAFLAFISFLLRNWPSDSVVPEADRLDLVCAPAWSRMQIWSQTARLINDLQDSVLEEQGSAEEEECEEALLAGDSDDPLFG
ncbi:E1B 19K [Canine mastadenovirus A]|uniref:E1B protein, small T-antigen n=1 Tax=Canine mastadenovirus A TaxID=10537 RepID=A0A6S6MEJ1_9ADEN|nr:E1B 19K [Canine mastadenovirus A]